MDSQTHYLLHYLYLRKFEVNSVGLKSLHSHSN